MPEEVAIDINRPECVSNRMLFAALDLERTTLQGMRTYVETGDFEAAAEAWANHMRTRTRPCLHIDAAEWPPAFLERYPQVAHAMCDHADKVVAGEIGHPPVRLPIRDGAIDWLANPTGETNYISCVGVHWFSSFLGRAYLLTGAAKYAEAFAWFFDSWYDAQADIRSVQTAYHVDTLYHSYYPGARLRILLDNYLCLAAHPALGIKTHLNVARQVVAAASWLYADNAEYKPGNQQVAAVTGMGLAGLLFPEFEDAEAWRTRAEDCLTRHLRDDFLSDGGHNELCTQYHKACLRDMGCYKLTCSANGISTHLGGVELERAYDWLAKLVTPELVTPALHSAVYATDWAVHLTTALQWYDRPDWRWLVERFWQTNRVPRAKMTPSPAIPLLAGAFKDGPAASPDWEHVHLDGSGFAVCREGWETGSRYVVLQYGHGASTHAYPSALALFIMDGGDLLAPYPGSTLSYKDAWYAYASSTLAHATVSIDGKSYPSRPKPALGGTLHSFVDLGSASHLDASHEGYKQDFGVVHRRQVTVYKDGGPIVIRDCITGGEGHTAQWNWPTSCAIDLQENHAAVLRGKAVYKLTPVCPECISQVRIEEGWSAVFEEDAAPNDIGRVIPVLRYEQPIGPEGCEFMFVVQRIG